ncbi:AgmX/PglI C-terminal domain-containing protein [Aliikangiella marina]|uniref:AgmX/PglI C-terminal domain-containing protein n=1 Tax=Aliikangiella marina TaxID=1712262 RepID=A0A545TIB6_9GAMM|nr:AgmX/PglI C-terminal domain-containing protein [Aliikangiella marina]TQV76943.1 AgmX/PglI C-terminal domain-containing protein [Aliikangiella marina]
MTTAVIQPLSPDLKLPWSPNAQQEEKFFKWTRNTFVVLAIFFVIIPWLPVFEQAYQAPEKEIVKTKVVLEAAKIDPPKPKPVKPKPIVKPKPKATPKAQAPKDKVVKDKRSSTAASKKQSQKTVINKTQGLDNISSQLNALRGTLNVAGMKKKKISTNKKGVVATVNRNITGENRATTESLGLDADDNIMKSTSVKLAAHETASVEGVVSSEGVNGGNSTHGSFISGQRDSESIRRTMDRNKGLLNALYQRRLNESPDMHGKFRFELVIEPNGDISNIRLISSELKMADLETALLSKIRVINFGVADVTTTKVIYTYNFLPS